MWPGQKWSYSQKSDFIKRLTIDLLIPKLHQQDESPMVHLWGTSGGVLRDAAPKQQLQPMSKKRSQPRRRSSNQPQSSVMLLQLMPLDLLPGCCSHIFNEMRLLARGQKSHPWCPSVCTLSSVHPCSVVAYWLSVLRNGDFSLYVKRLFSKSGFLTFK